MSTLNIPFSINLNYSKSAAMGFFSKGLKNRFETALVNEPSVFGPLRFGTPKALIKLRICGY